MPTSLDSGLYIDGKWDDSRSGQSVAVINPATEAEIGSVPRGTPGATAQNTIAEQVLGLPYDPAMSPR